ncbi:DMT family transporter [Paraneptunicella aestuarii]|uniref:DMT family transporter n=1 Tax=Paraneptunicella aestuarii TaxID=2831148 RepID=UPI001E2FD01C|nr:DMT family transporter [Paraneptunicella aestuarii]UAA38988.1 DMT family transporter [Paraneptunicella aestuarii]
MSSNLQQESGHFSGYLFAIAATIIWSGNFVIARGVTDIIPPVSVAFWRWVVAVVVFMPFGLPKMLKEWETIKQHFPYLIITSILGVTLFNTLIYFAGHSTTALNLSLISITFPVFIVIISRVFFGELITTNKLLGMVAVLVGVVLLVTRGNPTSLLNVTFAIGDFWMLLAAISFAVYSILLKKKPPMGVRAFQMVTFLIGFVILTPFYLWETAIAAPIVWNQEIIYSILYLGVFASLTAFILWNRAVAIVGPAKAGMVYYSLPIFSGLLANLILGESIQSYHYLCGALIISGIVTANYAPKRKLVQA